jgi:hypothetical protein
LRQPSQSEKKEPLHMHCAEEKRSDELVPLGLQRVWIVVMEMQGGIVLLSVTLGEQTLSR